MSHAATNWAIEQRGLKPATKIILWHLCDCHNPRMGCFPGQEYLASVCEMSRSSVNNHLNTLEKAGKIKRIINIDPTTKKQLPTEYKFPFQPEFDDLIAGQKIEGNPWSRVRNLDTEAVSKNEGEPCPNSGESRVQNLDTNPVREPVKEPSAPAGGDAPSGSPRRNGKRARADSAPPTDGPDPKLLRKRARETMIDWVLTGSFERLKLFGLYLNFGGPKPPGHDPGGEEALQIALCVSPSLRRTVVGAFDWVRNWIAGIDPKDPRKPYAMIVRHLRKWPNDTSRDARLEALRRSLDGETDTGDSDQATDVQTTDEQCNEEQAAEDAA